MSIWVCFTCSLPPSPCRTCKTRPSGRVYVFVTSLTLPIPSNMRNTPIWVCSLCSSPPPPRPSLRTQEIHPSGCVLRVRRLPHPTHPFEHKKYTHLGVFFVFASFLTERHAHLGMPTCGFYKTHNPYPSKPVPMAAGMGFHRYGCG